MYFRILFTERVADSSTIVLNRNSLERKLVVAQNDLQKMRSSGSTSSSNRLLFHIQT